MVIVHKHKGKWRVYENGAYTEHEEVFLKDVNFFVVPELQAQVRKTGEKVPHAFAVGEKINGDEANPTDSKWGKFDYDVFKNDTFVLIESGEPIYNARYVWLGKKINLILI
jgi:hypothetical protein